MFLPLTTLTCLVCVRSICYCLKRVSAHNCSPPPVYLSSNQVNTWICVWIYVWIGPYAICHLPVLQFLLSWYFCDIQTSMTAASSTALPILSRISPSMKKKWKEQLIYIITTVTIAILDTCYSVIFIVKSRNPFWERKSREKLTHFIDIHPYTVAFSFQFISQFYHLFLRTPLVADHHVIWKVWQITRVKNVTQMWD